MQACVGARAGAWGVCWCTWCTWYSVFGYMGVHRGMWRYTGTFRESSGVLGNATRGPARMVELGVAPNSYTLRALAKADSKPEHGL